MFKLYSHKLRIYLEMLYFVFLAITCVHNLFKAPAVVCLLSSCDSAAATNVMAMFSRSIAIVSFISRITTFYKSINDFPRYKKKIEDYEQYYPIDQSKKQFQRLCTMTMVFTYMILILPSNAYRIYLIYKNFRDMRSILFYVMMYIQNLSICWTEICFITHFINLFQQFKLINDEMAKLKSETITANKFPIVLKNGSSSDSFAASSRYNDGFSSSKISVHQLANFIELLRMRHQFVRNTVVELSDLYGIQIGLSVCVLFVMALCDIYSVISAENNVTKTHLLLYGWLLQYSLRFCIIVLTSHFTIKQAHKSKILITDINNRYIDNNTKEELQLFLNQLSGRPVEFSPCDFFTLNTHLITSAMVAGTTYLIILLHLSRE